MKRASLFLAAALALSPAATAVAVERQESPPKRLSIEELTERALAAGDRLSPGRMPLPSTHAATLQWTPLGPSPIAHDYWSTGPAAGRVSAVIVDPRDGDVAYIAAAQGGVWKTLNAGTSWTPLTDGLTSLASGALAFDPRDPDVIWYGTGEQHYSGDSFYGDGLFRSDDAGASWSKIATATLVGSYIARVVPHRQNPETLFVASSRGVVRSFNGGASWVVRLGGRWCDDLVVHPTNSDRVYAAMQGGGIYRTDNAAANWTKLGGGLPVNGFGRIQLAIAASNPLVLYASFSDPGGSLLGTYRTNDGGDTWTSLPAPNYLGGQGWYDHAIIVDPLNPDRCFAGGVFPYDENTAGVVRTENGGASWDDVTVSVDGSWVHPDQHNFAFGPDGRLWLVNDGGVWRTSDGGAHWTNANGNLNITQFYSIDVHPSDGNRILGGTQDNGTTLYEGVAAWPQVIGGDGGYCLFLWNQPNLFYTTYVALAPIFEWDDGTFLGTVTGPWENLGDRAEFTLAPLVQDFGTPNTMLAGTYRVWRTNDRGQNWAPISGDLAGGGDVLTALSVVNGAPDHIYSGASSGRLYVTTDAATWVRRDTGLPRKPIFDIALDPSNALHAWISADTAAGGRVWRTADAGLTWTNASGNLPAGVRGLCLAADFGVSPPTVYLGTDYGVYRSSDDGATWHHENAGIPSLAVYDLKFGPAGELVAGTHGRGMWRGTLPPVAVEPSRAPAALALAATNPARAPARIEFTLPSATEVTLEVFDVTGRRVREIARGPRVAGTHRALWDGRDHDGAPVAGGVYFYQLRAGGDSRALRFVLLK